MADFTISSADYIRPRRSPLGSPPVMGLKESTGQSFVFGDLLELDSLVATSAHRVARASTSGSTCISTSIVGIAAGAASSVLDTLIPVFEANRNVEFIGRSRGSTLASTNVGKEYGLFRDSSKNVWLVDLGNTQSTSARVTVTELIDSPGDSGGLVAFKFTIRNSTNIVFAFQGM